MRLIAAIIISIFLFSCNNEISVSDFNAEELLNRVRAKTGNSKKYYYFNVWNTSCIPCVKEMPSIDYLAGEYGNEVEFVFITEENDGRINRFLKEKSIHLSNSVFLNNEESTINYFCSSISKNRVYPMHFIVNNKFEIIHHHIGANMMKLNGKVYDPILAKALKKLE